MAVFDPFKINTYKIEELEQFVRRGISFSDMQQAGLNHLKQDELKTWVKAEEEKTRKDEEFWYAACKEDTLAAYEFYLKKFPEGIHVFEAELKIEEIKIFYEELNRDLITDMQDKPWRYNAQRMKSLFQGNRAKDAELENSTEPDHRFLYYGNKLTYSLLLENEIVPKDVDLKEAIVRPDYDLPQKQIQELGDYPLNRTDIYFLGIPASGKSSVLAGLFYKLYRDGIAEYVPQFNKEGLDLCQDYYWGLVRAIDSNKLPTSTQEETISFIKLDIKPHSTEKVNRVTMMEISGESFKKLANANQCGAEIWNNLGAGQCLKNTNRKLLFFLVDYSVVLGYSNDYKTIDQEKILLSALTVFKSDGSGNNYRVGCTMSKVDTVAVIVTKCDLMPDVETTKDRMDVACEYFTSKFKAFMNDLSRTCKEFGINKANEYKPYIITFSLGRFYIGNTMVYDGTDSERIADFIIKSTVVEKDRILDGLFK